MGGSLSSLCLLGGSKVEDCSSIRTLQPAPSLPKRTSFNARDISSLQDVCVRSAAAGLLNGTVQVEQLDCLPTELIQRVLDHVISLGELSMSLLQQLLSPWLHHLYLEGQPGLDDAWLPVVARATHLRALDLSASNLLTDCGMVYLAWLSQLTELRLQHCCSITDTGLSSISRVTGLKDLNLEGCEGLSTGCLATVGNMLSLTSLNLSQCIGIRGSGLHHLSGLQQLKNLQLGWCRDLGNIMQDHTNSINALTALTGLTQLNLAGTKAGDAQLATVLPFMKRLQVLDLSGSGMTELGLPALRPLAGCLKVLLLRRCQVLDSAGPAALAHLTQLQQLDLTCSGIGSVGLLALAPLTQLTELVLDMCRLGNEGCRVFRRLTRLERVDLSDTDVGDVGVMHLGRCKQLSWLSLCNTEVGDCCAASLTELTQLTYLNLDARCVSEASLRLLLPLGCSLRELDLYGACVKSRGATLLAAGYAKLEKLDLCGGHISDRACLELSKLHQLRALNLSQNRSLGDVGLRALAGGLGASLEVLNLSYTGVTDSSIPALAGMQALQVVVLSATAITAAGTARLQKLRPKLLVKATCRKCGGCC